MANVLQIPVPTRNAALVWPARSDPGVNTILLINQDLNNTIYIGQQSSITAGGQNTIPVPPNGSISVDPNSPWYVIGAVAGIAPLVMVPNGQANFLGLTQGLGKLAIPAIQSPNFIHNVSGWTIDKDGSAEFNNLVIRGTFMGNDFIINTNGIFFYNGIPALGTLLISLTNTAGSDTFGNSYPQGLSIFGPTGAQIILEDNGATAAIVLLAAGMVHNTVRPQIFGGSGNAGLASELTSLILSSGKENNLDDAALQLFSESADGTFAANAVIEFGGTVFCQITKTGLVLPGNPTPMPVAGSMLLFADPKGSLRVIDGNDQATYAAERKTLFSPNDSGSLVALTTLYGAQNVGAGSYRIHAQLYINVAVAGAEFTCQLTLPGGSTGGVGYTISRSTTFIGTVSGGVNTSVGAAVSLGAANGYVVLLDALFTVTVAGTLSFQVGSLTATGLVVGAFSFIEIMPV